MWFFWLLAAVAVLVYLGSPSKSKRRAMKRPVVSTADLGSAKPITTQTVAVKALADLLGRVGYAKSDKEFLRECVGDFKEAMKSHVEELRDQIAMATEEIADQRGEVDGCVEGLADAESPQERDACEKKLSALRAQLRVLEARLDADRAALKQFLADRSEFVVAYGNHLMHGHSSPDRSRQ